MSDPAQLRDFQPEHDFFIGAIHGCVFPERPEVQARNVNVPKLPRSTNGWSVRPNLATPRWPPRLRAATKVSPTSRFSLTASTNKWQTSFTACLRFRSFVRRLRKRLAKRT